MTLFTKIINNWLKTKTLNFFIEDIFFQGCLTPKITIWLLCVQRTQSKARVVWSSFFFMMRMSNTDTCWPFGGNVSLQLHRKWIKLQTTAPLGQPWGRLPAFPINSFFYQWTCSRWKNKYIFSCCFPSLFH